MWADGLQGKTYDGQGVSHAAAVLRDKLQGYSLWGELVCKGYDKADFLDAWERYLPRPPRQQPPEGATSATSATTEHYFDEHVREMTRHYEQAEAEAAKWAA